MTDHAAFTAEDIIAAIHSTLPSYPNIAHFITTDAISSSVTKDWPHEPAPMLYVLFMASGAAGATQHVEEDWPRSLLDRIEELISWLRSGTGVTGAWESGSRLAVTMPPRNERTSVLGDPLSQLLRRLESRSIGARYPSGKYSITDPRPALLGIQADPVADLAADTGHGTRENVRQLIVTARTTPRAFAAGDTTLIGPDTDRSNSVSIPPRSPPRTSCPDACPPDPSQNIDGCCRCGCPTSKKPVCEP